MGNRRRGIAGERREDHLETGDERRVSWTDMLPTSAQVFPAVAAEVPKPRGARGLRAEPRQIHRGDGGLLRVLTSNFQLRRFVFWTCCRAKKQLALMRFLELIFICFAPFVFRVPTHNFGGPRILRFLSFVFTWSRASSAPLGQVSRGALVALISQTTPHAKRTRLWAFWWGLQREPAFS